MFQFDTSGASHSSDWRMGTKPLVPQRAEPRPGEEEEERLPTVNILPWNRAES